MLGWKTIAGGLDGSTSGGGTDQQDEVNRENLHQELGHLYSQPGFHFTFSLVHTYLHSFVQQIFTIYYVQGTPSNDRTQATEPLRRVHF